MFIVEIRLRNTGKFAFDNISWNFEQAKKCFDWSSKAAGVARVRLIRSNTKEHTLLAETVVDKPIE